MEARGIKRFFAVSEHLIRRIADARVEEMLAWYDLGYALHCARHGPADDLNFRAAVTVLSEALDVHPSALRRCARISEAVQPREIEFLSGLRGQDGLPLTWSHVELLSEVRAKHERREHAIETCAKGLSVRELASRIRCSAKGETFS